MNTLLNYLLYLDNKLPEGSHPNGSILEDFSVYFASLIDQSQKTSSDYMKIINSNDMIPSTVKSDTADIGAGKSNPDKAKTTSATASKAAAAADATAAAVETEPATSATAVAKAEAAADEQTGQLTTEQPVVAEVDDADDATLVEIGEPDETAPATDAPAPVAVEAKAEADEAAAVAREDV